MSAIYKSAEGERLVREQYLKFLGYWPVPNRQLRLATRQGETFVIASGRDDAPPLVLLHGASFNSVMWMGDVAEWAKHFRVYAVDVIGHPGFSAPSRPAYESDAHAEWLDDVLAGLGVDRAAFVGMSLGGWIALDYAIRRPERVSSLALLCPGGVGRMLLTRAKLVLVILPLLLLGPWGRRRAQRAVLGALPGDDSGAAKAVWDFMSLINRHFKPNFAALSRFDDAALRGIRVPLLAILGARDALLDSAETRARLLANVRGADVRWLPDVGHAVVGQTQTILEFLRRVHAV
jgi:pimeloyl-ACP methyl ester carboxylesterase